MEYAVLFPSDLCLCVYFVYIYSYIYNIQDSFSEYFTALFKISLPALTPTQLSVLQLKCETKT